MKIRLPYNYEPRDYQLPFLKAFDSGLYDRFVMVWHRRAGKDLTSWSGVAIREAAKKPQIITYVFPYLKQAREVIWEGMDNEGNLYCGEFYLPRELLTGKPNSTNMTVKFKSGAILRLAGADSPDSMRGGNSKGFIFSEWAEMDPYAWTVARPIVLANQGWAIFIYTPKGDNHGKTTYELGLERDKTFAQLLKADETGVFTKEQLQDELLELIAENGESEGQARYDAEYMCSFDAPVIGSYYGAQIRTATNENRITSVPYDGAALVDTYWDLGVGDNMAIWFVQDVGKEIHVINYYENSGEGLPHYISYLKGLGYQYGDHWAPHDIKARELSTGKSRLDTARELGVNFREVPNISRDDGIDKARSILSRCWFDKKNTEWGVNALKNYRKEWDPKKKRYRDNPLHDWASDGADAFRYMAVAHRDNKRVEHRQPSYRRKSFHV